MFHRFILGLLPVVLLACSPALNWREVALAGGEFKAWLPCKPDQATRRQHLAGYDVDLAMQGCETAGGLYAVSVVEQGSPAALQVMQAQWQTQLLAGLQAQGASRRPYEIQGASPQPEPVYLQASGRGPEGRPLTVQAVWFVRGTRLYHAVLYAERITEEMSEPFFGGMRLQ